MLGILFKDFWKTPHFISAHKTDFKIECKSHPRTNSRVPWDAVELCCFEKISWVNMVKILERHWHINRSMRVYV